MKDLPKIVLPRGELRRRALETKLKEYEGRLDEMRKQDSYKHPQLFSMINSHSVYKHAILERLLEKGELDTIDFALELQKLHGFFHEDNYWNAARIINDYCMTGGINVKGGTGLQSDQKPMTPPPRQTRS